MESGCRPGRLPRLPRGTSAWVYRYRGGVSRQIWRFNSNAAPDLRFRYLFPYAGSLDFSVDRRGAVHYSSDATKAYAESLPPGVLIMPIVDARNDGGELDGWTDDQYCALAREVARAVIDDPNAAGVQIDIEPFRPDHLPFYRHLREMLNREGKYSTMFVGPKNKELLARIFLSCDMVVMSGYDLDGEGTPLEQYRDALGSAVARFQEVAEQVGGQYMVGIPAAASWGEYEYVAGGEGERVESGVKQEEYVQAALDILREYRGRDEYVGLALWHMSDPESDLESPETATRRTKFPNIIPESVWRMLESY